MSVNTNSQVLNLPIEDVIPNRFQPRLKFDESALNELSLSIKEHGIIQPLVVRKIGEKYEIIAGERRYKAAKMAGLTSVPAIITEMDDKQSAEVAIVENIQRKDLNPIEEARSYETLLSKGMTQEELAKKMGLSQSAVANKLRLLSLSESVKDALMEGKISERHARSLLQLKTEEEQNNWLKVILDERITVKELDNRLKGLTKKEEPKVNDVMEPPVELNNVMENNNVNNVPTNSIPDLVGMSLEPPTITNLDTVNNNVVEQPTNLDVINNNLVEPPVNIDVVNNNVESPTNIEPINNSNTIDLGIEEKPIPNKFFNFLEDEQANMKVERKKKATGFNDSIEMLNYIPEKPPVIAEPVAVPDISPVIPEVGLSSPSPDEIINNVIPSVEPINNDNSSNSGEMSVEEALANLGLIEKVEDDNSHEDEKIETTITENEEIPEESNDDEEEKEINDKTEKNNEEKNYDMDKAFELFDKLKKELREYNYSTIFTEEDDTKELKYTIIIKKEDCEEEE